MPIAIPRVVKLTHYPMIDMNRLRELTAELGFMPATPDEADIDRHWQLNKNA